MRSVISKLQLRGIAEDFSSGLEDSLGPFTLYMGFDPTADSLHLGHLAGIVLLRFLLNEGFRVVVLVGGATGMIGDPSGKNEERKLLSAEDVGFNANAIGVRLRELVGNGIETVDNAEWFGSIYWIDFLRDVAKHFRMGSLLSRESVKKRLSSEEGLSFTEFSYQLMQAYDFYHLSESHGVNLQVGGSDQWGNIVSGIDFVRRKTGKTVHGLTYPLLVNSDGKKIGKTESGTLWLNSDKTSPYEFYQYLLRLPDADLPGLMRSLTFMDYEEILEWENVLTTDPQKVRYLVADLITEFVHGESGKRTAKELTLSIAPGKTSEVDMDLCRSLMQEGVCFGVSFSKILGRKWIEIFVETNFCSSKNEVRRLISQNGLYINGIPLKDENCCVSVSQFLEGQFIVVGQGKKKKAVFYNQNS